MSVADGKTKQSARLYFEGKDHKAAFYGDNFVNYFMKPGLNYYSNIDARLANSLWFHKMFGDQYYIFKGDVIYVKQKCVDIFKDICDVYDQDYSSLQLSKPRGYISCRNGEYLISMGSRPALSTSTGLPVIINDAFHEVTPDGKVYHRNGVDIIKNISDDYPEFISSDADAVPYGYDYLDPDIFYGFILGFQEYNSQAEDHYIYRYLFVEMNGNGVCTQKSKVWAEQRGQILITGCYNAHLLSVEEDLDIKYITKATKNESAHGVYLINEIDNSNQYQITYYDFRYKNSNTIVFRDTTHSPYSGLEYKFNVNGKSIIILSGSGDDNFVFYQISRAVYPVSMDSSTRQITVTKLCTIPYVITYSQSHWRRIDHIYGIIYYDSVYYMYTFENEENHASSGWRYDYYLTIYSSADLSSWTKVSEIKNELQINDIEGNSITIEFEYDTHFTFINWYFKEYKLHLSNCYKTSDYILFRCNITTSPYFIFFDNPILSNTQDSYALSFPFSETEETIYDFYNLKEA